ncbi:ATP-binding protein [Mesobacterium pallidum]|uniref:hybrid sensor histidine kinase/response regulator n=1 Tax=Mesobacterium pallidum TaxID=2872037 RepID=UPI001EE21796|nr:ATP-binding protein [Mesobacterium pallidum]
MAGASVMPAGALFPGASFVLLAAGVTLVFLAVGLPLMRRGTPHRQAQHGWREVIDRDVVPCLVTDAQGEVIHANAAARARFGEDCCGDGGLTRAMRDVDGDFSAILLRLQARSEADGAAHEDIVTQDGHMRLAVFEGEAGHRIWRFQEFQEGALRKADAGAPEDVAMIAVGRGGAVLSMNAAARRLTGHRVKSLEHLFVEMPPRPGQINRIRTAEGTRSAVLAEVTAGTGRRNYWLLPAAVADGPAGLDFMNLPVPLLTLAREGKILTANHDARRLMQDDGVEGKAIASLVEGLGRPIADWLTEAADGRGLHRSEFLRLTGTERETFVQVTLSRVVDDGDVALIAVLNDATELKTLEAQFVQSQKMQAIGQLAGGVAHDFNNVLTAISGHCDLMLLRHTPDEEDYSDLVQINQNANRAASLVGQLLAFSRKQTMQPEKLDLRDTLADLTHLLNRLVGEKVILDLRHDPLLNRVRADKRQLEQVMMNLVVNGRDAMPRGGTICIETQNLVLSKPMKRDRVEVPPGNYVQLTVTDEGTGIAPDKLQKVFEPFFTTKRTGEGTGLGLSTVYGIVKQTGGYVFVDSELGQGTVFTLLFPAILETASDRPMPVEIPAELEAEETSSGEGVVLLVEDEAPVRAFASRALQMRGYKVVEADSAEAALEKLADRDLEIDVFVTDVVMPGMDGPSWVRQALKDRPDTRVVFVSGYSEANFGEGQEPIPHSVFLPKPFSLTDLTETVQRQLA